jgi:hypothetical protein
MGVLELIQQKAFIGKEFLTWLWFRAEQGGEVRPARTKPVKIEILGPIMLEAPYGDARAGTFKGDSPATSPEARTALLEGKKLKRARLKLTREDTEWTVTLDGENFNVSGLAIPTPGRLPFEETMSLRLEMTAEFEQALSELFDTFLEARLDTKAWAAQVKTIQEWVKNK